MEGDRLIQGLITSHLAKSRAVTDYVRSPRGTIGPYAAFRQSSKACMTAAANTTYIRFNSIVEEPVERANLSKLKETLSALGALKKLRLNIPDIPNTTSEMLLRPLSLYCEQCPNIRILIMTSTLTSNFVFNTSLIGSFRVLGELRLRSLQMCGSVKLPETMQRIGIKHVEQSAVPGCEDGLFLDISDCIAIEEINLSNFSGMQTIICGSGAREAIIQGCDSFERFSITKNETIFRTLTIKDCPMLQDVSPVFGVGLEELNLYRLESITLPSFTNCQTLKHLWLGECETDDGVINLRNLAALASFVVENIQATTILLDGCVSLQSLMVWRCNQLAHLAVPCENLQTLDLKDCCDLESLNMEGAVGMSDFSIVNCPSMLNLKFEGKPMLYVININRCDGLSDVRFDGECVNVSMIVIGGCKGLGPLLDVGGLPKLTYLHLNKCRKVVTIACGGCSRDFRMQREDTSHEDDED